MQVGAPINNTIDNDAHLCNSVPNSSSQIFALDFVWLSILVLNSVPAICIRGLTLHLSLGADDSAPKCSAVMELHSNFCSKLEQPCGCYPRRQQQHLADANEQAYLLLAPVLTLYFNCKQIFAITVAAVWRVAGTHELVVA